MAYTGAVPSRGAPHLPGSPGTPEREQAGVLFVRGRAIGMRVEELRKPWIQHVLRFLFAPARRPARGGRLTKALTKRTVSLVAKRKRARVESHPSLPASRFVTHPT